MPDYEAGKDALRLLLEWERDHGDKDRNEASTRFHIIDRIVENALGWPREDISVEVREELGVSDYELGSVAKMLLIEAKREGVTFELPAGYDKPEAAISTLSDLDGRIEGAMTQALGYCFDRGIPLAAVSNGHQWIGYLASRTDGVPPRAGRALVFSSLEDILRRFVEFWDAFSQPGVLARRLASRLQGGSFPTPPEKLSARLLNFPGYKNRNSQAAELQILGGMFLEDIARRPEVEPDFLAKCYYPSGTLSQYSLVSRQILETRYSLFFERETEASTASASDKGTPTPVFIEDVSAASLGQRPIILLGDVGVGKTIFIRKFITIDAADSLKRAVVLYVDFGNQPALTEDLNRFVLAEFVRQLWDDYGIDVYEDGFVRNVYQGEISRFKRGVAGPLATSNPAAYEQREIDFLQDKLRDLDSHLRDSLQTILRGRQRQTVIFLDNVDQRPSAFQEEVFLIAQSLASSWPCTCFVALRPETFHRSKIDGSLTGYQPRVFTIAPPRVDRVIQRRIAFARERLTMTGRLPSFPEGVSLDSQRLDSYMGVLERAFLDNSALVEFVENMSGGNVRRALDFVVSFVGSGHVDAGKIFDILARGEGYTLPLHEVLRAVIYGDHVYFDPSDSPIGNVFDIAMQDGREHFLLPLLLGLADRLGRRGEEEGFISIQRFFEFSQGLGFEPAQVDFALSRSRGKKMFDTFPRFTFEDWGVSFQTPTHLRLTSVGAYSIHRLLATLTYVDGVVVDTPIVDRAYADQIRDVHSIQDRIARARIFCSYLDSEWQKLGSDGLPFDWSSASSALLSDIERAEQGAIRRAST